MQSKAIYWDFETPLRKRGKNLTTLACMITDGYLEENKHTVHQQFPPASKPNSEPIYSDAKALLGGTAVILVINDIPIQPG